jgi:hypothetical protein
MKPTSNTYFPQLAQASIKMRPAITIMNPAIRASFALCHLFIFASANEVYHARDNPPNLATSTLLAKG